MSLTVKERGELTATYRFIEVSLMETLAQWVPTTPEMEIKLLFGAHIWDVAQHADALGKRTYELRLPLQFSMKPAEEYFALLQGLRDITDSSERMTAFYDVMLPALRARFRDYLNRTDALMDAPSVRILERIIHDDSRMIQECNDLREQLNFPLPEPKWVSDLAHKESSIPTVVTPKTAA